MTEREAIKNLKDILDECTESKEAVCYVTDVDAPALEMAINALEKQIPKKIKIEQWIYTKCDCGFEFSKHYGDGYYSILLENKTKYCPNCGKKIEVV